MSNRLSELAPAGRRTLRREIRLPILYLFTQLSTIDTTSVQFQLIVPGLHGNLGYALQPVVRVKSNKSDMKKHTNPMVDWRVLDHLPKFWIAMMVHAQVMLYGNR